MLVLDQNGGRHRSPWPESHRSHIATFQVFDLDHAVRIFCS